MYDEEPGIDPAALLMFLRKVMDNWSLPGPRLLRFVLYVEYEWETFLSFLLLRNPSEDTQKLSQVRAFHFYYLSPSLHALPVWTARSQGQRLLKRQTTLFTCDKQNMRLSVSPISPLNRV